MPDHRKHRGPHPEDARLFSEEAVVSLRQAVGDLSWLLTRGYTTTSSLKLVGDRYSLNTRQRLAVGRCACSDEAQKRRQSRQITDEELKEQELWIDGYNVLTSIEAALSGGVILHARDGAIRDMASMHGSYRKVEETIPALRLLGEALSEGHMSSCRWLLDQPVSNSGRLKTTLRELAEENSWNWEIELVPDPDPILIDCAGIVASADSQILDGAARWFDLAGTVIRTRVPTAWVVDLRDQGDSRVI